MLLYHYLENWLHTFIKYKTWIKRFSYPWFSGECCWRPLQTLATKYALNNMAKKYYDEFSHIDHYQYFSQHKYYTTNSELCLELCTTTTMPEYAWNRVCTGFVWGIDGLVYNKYGCSYVLLIYCIWTVRWGRIVVSVECFCIQSKIQKLQNTVVVCWAFFWADWFSSCIVCCSRLGINVDSCGKKVNAPDLGLCW